MINNPQLQAVALLPAVELNKNTMNWPAKKLHIFFVVSLIALGLTGQMAMYNAPTAERPEKVEHYLKKYRYLAVEVSQQTAIPVPLILAVAGLESDWGSSELAVQANNHFGLKVKSPDETLTYCKHTQEFAYDYGFVAWDCFRKYKLIRDSYADFGNFLTTRERYQALFRIPATELAAWAKGLQQSGYATDPEYAEKLTRIIREYQLDAL
jgi:flagellum-specific peptidoglycan hydrolase FlgJ